MREKVLPSGRRPAEVASIGIDQLLCYSVYAAGHAFNRVYKPLLDPLGLTYPKYLVMVVLWERDDRTVGELGERLGLESNTLTPLLKRMEADGLLRRDRDPQDERQVRVRLTPKGERLRAEAANVPACVLRASGKSIADVERLRDEIAALTRTLTSAPL